ncbi:type 2 isopentenyl-diphosphate Delta-isomerase [Sandaracinus amylolyticus]|uniref:type 2 isopentenyl-diphosphate Delta-isomerase n=1 Tax=Sandaracinus amylolyticus TaxID=927083 RepID=UPI001F279D8F|nr:type 2 isopentenyl-diphosphate Delta-isomerase [Sandaracinus amylolyticus]UJR84166.1 Hypothetical protein I5071_62370 [Sandaracinus amylolyticus]
MSPPHDEQAQLIEGRKQDHIRLCVDRHSEFRRKSTLLEEVDLVHHALSERRVSDVDLRTTFLGKTLRAPIVISAMTGGTADARAINRDLARAAETLGIAFGLGSQRAMALRPESADTYEVRDVAPSTVILGNLGIVQARAMSTDDVRRLVERAQVDALCIHLNPAMELIQPHGDRDFTDGLRTLERLVRELPTPVVVKETGCGISLGVARAVREVGVRAVDVSGAGGTSWVAVEARRVSGATKRLGEALWDWGIPTAPSVVWAAEAGLEVVATGGLRTGIDVAHALALGATLGGLAAPVLRAQQEGGYDGAVEYLRDVIDAVRAITFLTGSESPSRLRDVPRVMGPRLNAWLSAEGRAR